MACCAAPSCLTPEVISSLCFDTGLPLPCCNDSSWRETPDSGATLAKVTTDCLRISGSLDDASQRKAKADTLRPAPLSQRGTAHASKLSPFYHAFDKLLSDPYCPNSNRGGVINMGIANNSLMSSELLTYFHNHLELEPIDLTYGSSLYGSTRFFDALCHHLNGPDFAPLQQVEPRHILTGPGAAAILDQVFEHLADPGEGVLCAAPYFNGFDADLATRSRVRCIPVFSPDGDGTEASSFTGASALRGFAAAYTTCAAAGAPIRAVLVCNPNNPVGRCYDRAALIHYGRFAAERGLHLVFDEIYALSVFPTEDDANPQRFISALSIDWQNEAGLHPGSVHIISSASKDWGLNGFRIGTLVSQNNEQLLSAMKVTSKLYMISSPADALFSHLLRDDSFNQPFTRLNRARLSAAYSLIRAWCRHHSITYTPSNAGHFLLVDLSNHLEPLRSGGRSEREAEAILSLKALDRRVCITPGSNYHHPTPGVFRVSFALKREELLTGLKRLEMALGLEPWQPVAE